MNLLKTQLITASALKSINYHKGANDIVLVINVNNYEWRAVLMQYAVDSKQKWHFIRYKSRVWSFQKTAYNIEKKKYRKNFLALKKLQFWLYKVYFILEVNANTFVTQLNQAAINLLKVFVTQ